MGQLTLANSLESPPPAELAMVPYLYPYPRAGLFYLRPDISSRDASRACNGMGALQPLTNIDTLSWSGWQPIGQRWLSGRRTRLLGGGMSHVRPSRGACKRSGDVGTVAPSSVDGLLSVSARLRRASGAAMSLTAESVVLDASQEAKGAGPLCAAALAELVSIRWAIAIKRETVGLALVDSDSSKPSAAIPRLPSPTPNTTANTI